MTLSDNLYSLFESRFPADRSAPLLLLEGGGTVSYADAQAGSSRYAALLAGLGLNPGDRVAVQVEKSPEALLLYLGCLRAGLVYLPLNSAYQEGEVEYFLENAEPRAVVAQPRSLSWLEPLAQRLGIHHVFSLDEQGQGTLPQAASGAAPRFKTVERCGDDLAAILYTSGTTGRSKGAMITHRNLASNALVLHRSWGFRPGDVLVHMLPLFHVHGLFVASHCVLVNGSAMRFHAKFDARQAIADFAVSSVFMGVPTFYTRLLAEPGLTREACAQMRLFVAGSAPLLAETHVEFEQRTGQRILERYGMTETGMLTSNPLSGERRAGSVGPALEGSEVRVVDNEGNPCRAGDNGHVLVRGANVFPGYWRMPERNAEEFTADGYFRTGDMGNLSEDGYLTIAGRSKDLIISGGYNVYPKEIELALDELPEVQESAVVGVPHPDFGEAVTAVVVPRSGAAATEPGIIAALKGKLANFKIPKRVYFVEELPRNAMGKVQKNILRDKYRWAKDRDMTGARSILDRIVGTIAGAGIVRTQSQRRADRLSGALRTLISERGEASGAALARRSLTLYRGLDSDGRLHFFESLASDFSPDREAVLAAATAYHRDASPANLATLQRVAEPPRQEVFRRMNMAPGGTALLLELRRELLEKVKGQAALAAVDDDLTHLLGSWFNRGFLELRRIDWGTPASILEKLIAYEAVHEIHGFPDLKRRLERDRRCFAFFHPALPDEPLIFVEVAFVNELPAEVAPILALESAVGDPRRARCAVFYSITSCQPGLRGISFGNFLIKQVAADLHAELPNLKVFATLSPIPGLRGWAKRRLQGAARTATSP